MKITRRPTIGPTDLGATPPVVETDGSERRAPASGGDRVQLSDGARLRLRLKREIGEVDTVDASRVADLRARVAAGTYRPSAEDVAERFLREIGTEALAGG